MNKNRICINKRKRAVTQQNRGVKLIFTGGHISLVVAFKGPNVVLGLYKCNYSLTRGKELYIWPFEGNCEADVAPGENEFETLVIEQQNEPTRTLYVTHDVDFLSTPLLHPFIPHA